MARVREQSVDQLRIRVRRNRPGRTASTSLPVWGGQPDEVERRAADQGFRRSAGGERRPILPPPPKPGQYKGSTGGPRPTRRPGPPAGPWIGQRPETAQWSVPGARDAFSPRRDFRPTVFGARGALSSNPAVRARRTCRSPQLAYSGGIFRFAFCGESPRSADSRRADRGTNAGAALVPPRRRMGLSRVESQPALLLLFRPGEHGRMIPPGPTVLPSRRTRPGPDRRPPGTTPQRSDDPRSRPHAATRRRCELLHATTGLAHLPSAFPSIGSVCP